MSHSSLFIQCSYPLLERSFTISRQTKMKTFKIINKNFSMLIMLFKKWSIIMITHPSNENRRRMRCFSFFNWNLDALSGLLNIQKKKMREKNGKKVLKRYKSSNLDHLNNILYTLNIKNTHNGVGRFKSCAENSKNKNIRKNT